MHVRTSDSYVLVPNITMCVISRLQNDFSKLLMYVYYFCTCITHLIIIFYKLIFTIILNLYALYILIYV